MHCVLLLGNSSSAILDGSATLTLLRFGEEYIMNMPYAHCKGNVVYILCRTCGREGRNDARGRSKRDLVSFFSPWFLNKEVFFCESHVPPLSPPVSQASFAPPLISQASFALPPCVSSLPCLPPSCLKPSLPSSPLSRASLCTLSCLTPPSSLLFPLSQAFLDLPFLSQTSLSCPPSKASPRSIDILVSHDALSWTLLLHCCYGSVGCCFAWQTLGGS